MADRRAPNWGVFTAASQRVGQSTHQIAQALQASAHIPDDLTTIAAELTQLQYQPTNLMLQQQMNQFQERMEERTDEFQERMERRKDQSQERMERRMNQSQERMDQTQERMDRAEDRMNEFREQMQRQTEQTQDRMDQFQQQMQVSTDQTQTMISALNTNIVARVLNSACRKQSDELTPLVHPQTSTLVANFPATSKDLTKLTWAKKRALGINLGLADPGPNPNRAAKSAHLARIRSIIGLTEFSA